jgi:hypothetical protein
VVAGFALFPAVYALCGLLLWRILALPAAQVALLLAVSALLGFISLSSRGWISRSVRSARLRWLELRTPELISRARQARVAVVAMLAAERPRAATAAPATAASGARAGSAV